MYQLNLQNIAGLGILVASWNYIKIWWGRISSLFFVKIEIYNHSGSGIEKALLYYLKNNYNKIPLCIKRYTGINSYIRPLKRNQLIAFEGQSSENIIYFNKKTWYKILTVNNSSEFTKITFFRFLFSHKKLLEDILEQYNNLQNNTNNDWKTNNRFFVVKKYGNLGIHKTQQRGYSSEDSKSNAVAEPCGSADSNFDARIYDIIKWKEEEIGQPQEKSPINILSLKQDILQSVEEAIRWRSNEKWFKDLKIPWKRGWLLYGKPGTGKTAFVRALAQEINMPIINFDLSTMTNQDFNKEWQNVLGSYNPCICLFEDIDAVFNGRENIVSKGKMENGITFDCFLNCIDGVENTDGIFIIITTNHLESLDSAIGIPSNGDGMSTRPGRIDKVIEFTELDNDGREKMANRILTGLSKDIINNVIKLGKEYNDTGAQFQERCGQIALKLFWEKQHASN